MAKSKYQITLTLTAAQAGYDYSVPIGHAKDAAKWHNVLGADQNPLDEKAHRKPPKTGTYTDGTIYWRVYGELSDVLLMCNRWAGSADTDATGTSQPEFAPTVQVQLPVVPLP
jgi:hypothetical protein